MEDLLTRPVSSVPGLFRKVPRIIEGLLDVEECVGPFRDANTALWRDKGATGDGLRYERAVHKALARQYRKPAPLHNLWLRFHDKHGAGYACPDIVLPGKALLVECKLSWTNTAIQQVEQLYVPLLEKLYDVPAAEWIRVIVCKHWRAPVGLAPQYASLQEPLSAISEAKPGLQAVLLPQP